MISLRRNTIYSKVVFHQISKHREVDKKNSISSFSNSRLGVWISDKPLLSCRIYYIKYKNYSDKSFYDTIQKGKWLCDVFYPPREKCFPFDINFSVIILFENLESLAQQHFRKIDNLLLYML